MLESELIVAGLDRSEGGALAPDGRLLVVETGAGRLAAIDLAIGAVSSVAVGPSGAIYVTADEANVLYRIDPVE